MMPTWPRSLSCVVSDRVYINSIADGNVKSGKLGGYGGGKQTWTRVWVWSFHC